MRKGYIVISLLFLFISSGCDTILNLEEKPEVVDRNTNYKIQFTDATGSMQKLYGSPAVPGVSVVVKSNTTRIEYKFVSDSDGMIYLNNILSDKYIISAVRLLSDEEMEVISGQKLDFYKLVCSKTGTVDLRADNPETITISMDELKLETPLVISEIYAAGPPGSGLYFHDKYVEVYNQSDSVAYLDGLIIATVYHSSYLGQNYVNDPEFVHTKSLWTFPGSGRDHPIQPGQFVVCAEDAINHTVNAPKSVDLSHVSFEFYKDDAPDIDNPAVTNMVKIYQSAGNDWLIGGEKGGIVLAQYDTDSLQWFDDQMLIPFTSILDGVEYLDDPTRLDLKVLSPVIDKGATGGISFYTGKTMERILIERNGRSLLKDENNSSLDFQVYESPTPEYYSGKKN
jgi:hypothetical protein